MIRFDKKNRLYELRHDRLINVISKKIPITDEERNKKDITEELARLLERRRPDAPVPKANKGVVEFASRQIEKYEGWSLANLEMCKCLFAGAIRYDVAINRFENLLVKKDRQEITDIPKGLMQDHSVQSREKAFELFCRSG